MTPADVTEMLERLAAEAGLDYLSDLHNKTRVPLVRAAVSRLRPTDFSLAAWNGVNCYILGDVPEQETARKARAYLIERLAEQPEAKR